MFGWPLLGNHSCTSWKTYVGSVHGLQVLVLSLLCCTNMHCYFLDMDNSLLRDLPTFLPSHLLVFITFNFYLLVSFHSCTCSYFSTVLIFVFILHSVQTVLLHLVVPSGHKFSFYWLSWIYCSVVGLPAPCLPYTYSSCFPGFLLPSGTFISFPFVL